MTQRNLLVAAALVALFACGSKESTPTDVELTDANAANLVSTVWLDNTVTDASELLAEAGPLLLHDFGVIALQPNGATTDVSCHASGKLSLTGQVADAQRPGWTVGDRVTATFAACKEATDGYADTVDGVVTLEITAVALSSRTFTVVYADYATSVPTFGTFTASGTVTMTVATDGDVTTVTADAERFTGSGGGLQEVVEHRHVKLVDSGNTLDAAFSLEFSATSTSSRWGNKTLRYETPVAFAGTADTFPSQGQLLLHGANGATARLTALDATNVRLDLDLDGDGAVDSGGSRTLTWIQIDDADFGDAP